MVSFHCMRASYGIRLAAAEPQRHHPLHLLNDTQDAYSPSLTLQDRFKKRNPLVAVLFSSLLGTVASP
eukprot:2093364-Amphidinium_carterae.2